jgi:hemerythrin-like domain-containing protein
MKATALLREDHKHLLRALNVLEEMKMRVQRDQDVSGKDVDVLVDFLRNFGDRHHQGKEEDVLFPALLQDREQKNYQELSHLILEHDRDRSLVDGLQDSTLTKKANDFVYSAGKLIEILRKHIQHEDTVLLPLVDATLSLSQDESVARDMKSYDRLWQDRELAGQLAQLDILESKYVRPAA